jgi:hypothetical protein
MNLARPAALATRFPWRDLSVTRQRCAPRPRSIKPRSMGAVFANAPIVPTVAAVQILTISFDAPCR